MSVLFAPLMLGQRRLRNRIVRAPLATGMASPGGFVSDELANYYIRRAAGGAGLIMTEPISVVPLDYTNVLALHDDNFVPELRRLCLGVQGQGALVATLLGYPLFLQTQLQTMPLEPVREAFLAAAWRAHAAGSDIIMVDGADGSLLHQVLSPHANHRDDSYGGSPSGRSKLAIEIVEAIRGWLGPATLIGYRLPADDLLPDGLSLQDSRVLAKRLVAAGVGLLDITAGLPTVEQQIARFPGWQAPLSSAIRSIAGVPVIANGDLDDPVLAESILMEGSGDLIAVGDALDNDPDWPHVAAQELGHKGIER